MDELNDYTGYLLRLAFLQSAGIAAKTFPAGVHPRDAAILASLVATGPASQQRLGELLNVNRTMMVKLIDTLEARRLVERHRNPEDRRSYALVATEDGRAALELMVPLMDRAEDELAGRLTLGRRARLVELLGALIEERPPAVGGRLGFVLAKAHHRFHERADEVLRPIGIEIRHFSALKTIARGTPSQRALADRLHVSGPVVVEMVDALEARGLVERRRDPEDRRNNILEVTEAGHEALERAGRELTEASGELTAPIGEDGARELNELLRALLGL